MHANGKSAGCRRSNRSIWQTAAVLIVCLYIMSVPVKAALVRGSIDTTNRIVVLARFCFDVTTHGHASGAARLGWLLNDTTAAVASIKYQAVGSADTQRWHMVLLSDEDAVNEAVSNSARVNCTAWRLAAEYSSPLDMNGHIHTFSTVVFEQTHPRFWYLAAVQCDVPAPTVPSIVDFHARFLNPGGEWARQFSKAEQAWYPLCIAGLGANGLVMIVAFVSAVFAYKHKQAVSSTLALCTVAFVNAVAFSLMVVHFNAFATDGEGMPTVLLAGHVLENIGSGLLAMSMVALAVGLFTPRIRQSVSQSVRMCLSVGAVLLFGCFVGMPLWAWHDTPITSHYYGGTAPGVIEAAFRVAALLVLYVLKLAVKQPIHRVLHREYTVFATAWFVAWPAAVVLVLPLPPWQRQSASWGVDIVVSALALLGCVIWVDRARPGQAAGHKHAVDGDMQVTESGLSGVGDSLVLGGSDTLDFNAVVQQREREMRRKRHAAKVEAALKADSADPPQDTKDVKTSPQQNGAGQPPVAAVAKPQTVAERLRNGDTLFSAGLVSVDSFERDGLTAQAAAGDHTAAKLSSALAHAAAAHVDTLNTTNPNRRASGATGGGSSASSGSRRSSTGSGRGSIVHVKPSPRPDETPSPHQRGTQGRTRGDDDGGDGASSIGSGLSSPSSQGSVVGELPSGPTPVGGVSATAQSVRARYLASFRAGRTVTAGGASSPPAPPPPANEGVGGTTAGRNTPPFTAMGRTGGARATVSLGAMYGQQRNIPASSAARGEAAPKAWGSEKPGAGGRSREEARAIIAERLGRRSNAPAYGGRAQTHGRIRGAGAGRPRSRIAPPQQSFLVDDGSSSGSGSGSGSSSGSDSDNFF